MATTVNIDIANPDPDAAPLTFLQAVQLLRTLISGQLVGTFTPYVTGSSIPAVEDQDKIWHKYDSAGRPLGTFKFYNGTWRREYTGRAGDVKLYSGNPNTDFDGTGLGIIGGNQDGWALANGQNGTANLSNQFIVGAAMDDAGIAGYSGGVWRTSVDGTAHNQGGLSEVTLTDATTFRPARDAAGVVDIWMADGNVRASGGDLYGVPAAGGDQTLLPADAGNLTPDPISIIPPYYALAILGWVGYA